MDRKGKKAVPAQDPQKDAKQVPEFTWEQMNLLLGKQPQLLGEGLSEVYKGELVVAVKQFYKTERMLKELNNYSKLSHPNIAKLFGYYKTGNDNVQLEDAEEDHQIRSSLLLEFMPEGDLLDYLFKGNKPMLSWDKRIIILLDISKALTYLHGRGLVYRDLKAKNVLLDSELRAKLCDFGSLVPDRASVPFEGITGYFEVYTLRDETPQIFHDVYAFGVLMLEVLLQRRAFKNKSGLTKSIVNKYFTMRLVRRAADMPSKKMNGEFEVQSLKALLKIAEKCLLEEPTNYMRMETVMKELEKWSK